MISCLTVTQPSRLSLVALAVGDFARQTHADSELVMVHEGDEGFDSKLRHIAETHSSHRIHVHAAAAGTSLGALRNLSVQFARGDCICQWDDDDRHHPLRLELQYAALLEQQADFCFPLRSTALGFPQRGELFWDDWEVDPYPLNFVQGTLLGHKAAMPLYPEIARGEDTELVLRMMRAQRAIVRLRDRGWAYIYVYHGANVFPAAHHAAISRLKCYSGARLLARESVLRQRFAEYVPGIGPVTMPWQGGAISLP